MQIFVVRRPETKLMRLDIMTTAMLTYQLFFVNFPGERTFMDHSLRGEVHILRETRTKQNIYRSKMNRCHLKIRINIKSFKLLRHLELRSSIQPALVLAEALPVLRFPNVLIDALQYPSATCVRSLEQGQI